MSQTAEILIVEDDRDELDVALRALRRAGIESVDVARDGQEALEAVGIEPAGEADASRRQPRVIFLDLKMPRVDGWEVLRRLRGESRTAHLPVVVLSSSDDPRDVQRAYELGANSFLLKRYDDRGPGTYLAEAARYWLQLNHTALPVSS